MSMYQHFACLVGVAAVLRSWRADTIPAERWRESAGQFNAFCPFRCRMMDRMPVVMCL